MGQLSEAYFLLRGHPTQAWGDGGREREIEREEGWKERGREREREKGGREKMWGYGRREGGRQRENVGVWKERRREWRRRMRKMMRCVTRVWCWRGERERGVEEAEEEEEEERDVCSATRS